MKLKRLDIHGFKSFYHRTTVVIDDGITGVVGPNGCGKSNIVEGLRLHQTRSWVVCFSNLSRFGPRRGWRRDARTNAGRRVRRLALVDRFRRRAHEGLSKLIRRGERSLRRDRISSFRWRRPRHLSFWSGKSLTRLATLTGRHLRHVRRFDRGVVLLLSE